MNSNKTIWILLAIFLLALGVRFGNIAMSSQGIGEIHDDAVDYHWYAVNLMERGTFMDGEGHMACRMPGYALFVSSVYSCFGKNVLPIQIVQSIFNAFACVLLFLIGRKLLPSYWAFLPSVIAAFYFDFFTGSARFLSESIYLFLLTSFMALWFYLEKKKGWHAYSLGLLLGVAILFRPEALLLGALAGFFLDRTSWRKRLTWAVFFWLGIGSVLTPWAIRNYKVSNSFIPLTSRAGASAFVGLQQNMNRLGVVEEQFVPLSPDEFQDGHLQYEKAKSFYRKMPIKTLLKSFAFNFSIFFYPFHPFFDWTMVFCMPFWFYAVWLIIRRKMEGQFLLLYLGCLMAAYLFFGATASRYREPLAPVVVLLTAIGIFKFNQRVGNRVFIPSLFIWFFLNMALWSQAPKLRLLALNLRDRIWL